MPASTAARTRLRTAALTLAIWVGVGAFFFLTEVLQALARGGPAPGLQRYLGNFVWMASWALFTPAIFAATRRFPLMGGLRASHVLWHVALFVGVWLADTLVGISLAWCLDEGPRPFWRALTFGLYASVMLYGATLAVAHAARFHALSVQRQVRASELEAQLLRSQLHALQMQLHPHFLFNALHTVSALVRTDEKQAALQTVASLGDLLRTVLHSDGLQEVPLRQELELVQRYLHIEGLRFQERLRTRFSVAPELSDALVPQLLLQPLVENAVRHGMRTDGGEGSVEVEVRREGAQLVLRVRDSGPGDAPRAPGGSGASNGIGLANTRARLERLYGAHHRLQLTPTPEGGILAEVAIPLRRATGVAA